MEAIESIEIVRLQCRGGTDGPSHSGRRNSTTNNSEKRKYASEKLLRHISLNKTHNINMRSKCYKTILDDP